MAAKKKKPHFDSRCCRIQTAKVENRHEKKRRFCANPTARIDTRSKKNASFARIRLLKLHAGPRKRAPGVSQAYRDLEDTYRPKKWQKTRIFTKKTAFCVTFSADPDCVSRKKPPKNAPFARIRLRLSSPCGRKWGPDGGPFWPLSHDSVDGFRLLKSKMGPFFTALVDGLRLRKSERNPVSTAALSRNRLPKPQRGVKKTARPHFRSRCRRMPTAKAEKRHEKNAAFPRTRLATKKTRR